ncbi:MAG TPA: ABC transporter substrate-binding protein, partial [Actinomycetota bacterium]|nr:ABC transporter substrate-binding protein [Actinomycetota bacterium]
TQPTGDFLDRLTLPATAPIPREIAGCFDRSRGYGPNLVATGPFMIEGSDDLDPTSCDSLTPAAGFDPSKRLSLVRNPDYDPATDDPGIRDPGFDRYRFSIQEDPNKTLTRLEKGRVDLSTGDVGIDTLRRYVSDPQLRNRLHVEQDDRLWYLAMNLTEPPFDDLHVRRAVNLVMDKDLLQRAWGGAIQGEIATHILPDSLVDEPGLDPYASHHHEGDVAAARREMRRSRYDHDDDGRCDAAVCRGVLHVTRTDGQWESLDDVVTESLAKIGIELDTRVPDDPYGYITTARSPMAITSLPSWVKDYPDPFAILGFLMSGANITATDNYNYSLVGLTKATAERLHVAYPRGGVPSVDAEIARCESILVNSDRQTCWSALDRRVMLDVAPWVPYLSATRRIITSDRVEFVFDGAAGEVSFAHLGLRSP